jgi:hypothetical protein
MKVTLRYKQERNLLSFPHIGSGDNVIQLATNCVDAINLLWHITLLRVTSVPEHHGKAQVLPVGIE